jgi:hypothetical protein
MHIGTYASTSDGTRPNGSVTVQAMKAEVGNVQTLAHQDADGNWVLNEIPNYHEEFLKCIQSTVDPTETYANEVIYHTGNKPTAENVGAAPTNHTHDSEDVSLTVAADLFALTASGTFSYGATTLNTPYTAGVTTYAAGICHAFIGTTYHSLCCITAAGQIFVNRYYNSEWQGWKRLYSEDYKPTATDIGITGGISSALTTNFSANRAIISNENGKLKSSTVTSTELGHLSGVTNPIQTQLDSKLPKGSIERIEGTADAPNDLNNYTTHGFYNVKTTNVSNCPEGIGIDAVLLVYPWNTNKYVTQEITESAGSAKTRRWLRHSTNTAGTTWTAWSQFFSGDSIIPIANGGTGATTARAGAQALIGALSASTTAGTSWKDDMTIVVENTAVDNTYYRRSIGNLWQYINKKNASVSFAECDTAADTQTKVVTCSGFSLVKGARICIRFTNTNSATEPMLNINSTGAKAVVYRGSTNTASLLAATRMLEFMYDGANYELITTVDNNSYVT